MADNSLAIFEFQEQPIRAQNRNGELWYSLNDIAKACDCKSLLQFHRTNKGKELFRAWEEANNESISNHLEFTSKGKWASWGIVLLLIDELPIKTRLKFKDWFYSLYGLDRKQVAQYLCQKLFIEGGVQEVLEKIQNEDVSNRLNFCSEREHSDYLALKLDGEREVPVDGGFIDVLTDTEVIEVKEKPDWLKAVKQVNRYHVFYPTKKKRIHLFGKSRKYSNNYILEYCSKLGVAVTFAEEIYPL